MSEIRKILATKKAEKQIRSLPFHIKKKIDELIDHLKEDPLPAKRYDLKKIRGKKDVYRIRIGNYRVIYKIQNDVIIILLVIQRKQAYR